MNTIGRWKGTFAGSLVLVGLGLFTSQPAFFIAAAFPLVFELYSTTTTPPDATDLTIVRDISPANPRPGERATVTVTVENNSTTPISDVRLVDGVPNDLAVTDGSPRAALALRPNSKRTYTYTLSVSRGTHEFSPVTLRLRSLSADQYITQSLEATGDTTLECTLDVTETPLTPDTTPYTGTLTTDSPGEGLEFHSTRDYQYGDSISRINWREYAKTGSLTTIDYNEPRAAQIMLVVDVRDVNDGVAYPGAPSGSELSAYAGAQLLHSFRGENHTVGISILKSTSTGDIGVQVLEPTTDAAILQRGMGVLESLVNDTDPTDDVLNTLTTTDTTEQAATQLCKSISTETQVVYLTPALDDESTDAAETIQTYGHGLTIISPAAGGSQTLGQTVAGLKRSVRLDTLRSRGVETIDWAYDTPLELLLNNRTPNTQATTHQQ